MSEVIASPAPASERGSLNSDEGEFADAEDDPDLVFQPPASPLSMTSPSPSQEP